MSRLRAKIIRIASQLRVGHPARRKLLLLAAGSWFDHTTMDMDVWFDHQNAVEALRGDVAWWVQRGAGKKKLFQTWKQLSEAGKAALDLSNAAVLPGSLTLYREMAGYGRHQGIRGASFTDDRSLFPNATKVRMKAGDVLVCYRTPGFEDVLGGDRYRHEREYIIKP